MKPFAFLRLSTRYLTPRLPLAPIRKASTTTSTLESTLQRALLTRPPNIIHDYLSPTPSHLLSLSLQDFLPPASLPHLQTPPHLPGRHDELPLPQGHHLVYFSAQLPASSLLADGTDTLHSPGPPFTRRLWGGGSLLFNAADNRKSGLDLDGTRVVCVEKITDVKVKGREGEEKVFVEIERRVGLVGRKVSDRAHDSFDEEWPLKMEERVRELEGVSGGEEEGGMEGLAVIERRALVFLREGERVLGEGGRGRVVKPLHEPDNSVPITPTNHLLFRFSALSFNAHSIHLDPQYSREVEGYPNLLVHGPLTLVLMLSVLRSQLQPGEMITKFDYRNLAPLFAGEEMRVCVRRDRGAGLEGRWDVWIVGKEGGYAVKGSAVVGVADAVREEIV